MLKGFSVLSTPFLYTLFPVESSKLPLVNFPKTTWLLVVSQLFLVCSFIALVVLFKEDSLMLVLPLRSFFHSSGE